MLPTSADSITIEQPTGSREAWLQALVVLISDNDSSVACPLIMIDWNRKKIGMQMDAEAEVYEENDDDSTNRSLALLLLVVEGEEMKKQKQFSVSAERRD
jgi:hypothetical protein